MVEKTTEAEIIKRVLRYAEGEVKRAPEKSAPVIWNALSLEMDVKARAYLPASEKLRNLTDALARDVKEELTVTPIDELRKRRGQHPRPPTDRHR